MKISALVPLLLSAALVASCHRRQEAEAADAEPSVADNRITFPPQSSALTSLRTAPVQRAEALRTHLNGRVVWNDEATARIYAPFAGRVERVLANVANPVAAGDTLALIASPDYAQAQADAGKAAADEALAERNADRLHTLYEHGAAAEKDVQAAEADLARARAERARAENTLKMRAGVVVGPDGESLFPLKSPVAGVVVERNVNTGQEVRPDQMLANAPQFFAPLFVVSDPTHLWVLIDATENDLAGLRPGTPIALHAAALPGQTFRGAVDWISDAIDPTSRMIKVRGRVENPDRLLKAEMFVRVDFSVDGPPALEVPATAVFIKGDRHFAYVAEGGGRFLRREVQVGIEHDGRVQVTAGLRAGEHVVSEGALLLDEILADASSS